MNETEINIAAVELARDELANIIQMLEFRQSLGVEPDQDEIIAVALDKIFRPAHQQVGSNAKLLRAMQKFVEEDE